MATEPDKIEAVTEEVEFSPQPTATEELEIKEKLDYKKEIDTDDTVEVPVDTGKTVSEGKKRESEYKKEKKKEEEKRKQVGEKKTQQQKQAEAFDLYNGRTKSFEAYSKMMEAQSNAERITFNSLVQKYNFAKGQVSKMPVSTEALKHKMGTPPEMQEAPEFDPKTGRVLAQLAGSIIAGFGLSHAGVKSATAVGMDVVAGGVEQNIVRHSQAVQAVAKRNDELMVKYHDDIDGLFKEYDKAENQSLRDYAQNKLRMEEMNFRKEAKALDVEARNADRRLRANIASIAATQRAKQITMSNAKYQAALKKGEMDGIWRVVTGGEKQNYRNQIKAEVFSPEMRMARDEALHDFTSSPVPNNIVRENWKTAQRIAGNMHRIVDKEEDGLIRQRMHEYTDLLLQKGIIMNPVILRELANSPTTYNITSLEVAYRGRIAVPVGFNAAVLDNAMKVSANPSSQEIAMIKNLAQGTRFALLEMQVGKAGQANFEEKSWLPFSGVKKEKIKGSWGGYAEK